MRNNWLVSLFLLLILISFNANAGNNESQTANYFEIIKSQPQKLQAFLTMMPKGGDLHNHASGATYAENLIQYAAKDNLCVDPNSYALSFNPSCKTTNLLQEVVKDPRFKDALIDAWSMQHFTSGKETGHDHFFSTFGKFGLATDLHRGQIISEISTRAAKQHELYVELMVTPDSNASGKIGKKIGWHDDLEVLRKNLLASAEFQQVIKQISAAITQDENERQKILQCHTAQPKVGCSIELRYLYQVLREQPPEMVFAQILAGFEVASKDKRFVGINLVQPEDGLISMRDYALHMRIIGFLHTLYPDVKISLHAGELAAGLVPADGLTFHINDAVKVAQANRIGHGVDIMQETNASELLQKLAETETLVEINLTSNDEILNVKGSAHPLPMYLKYNVPVALSTDDEGVSRGNLTNEYVKAVNDFQLNYFTLKKMTRNSLEYAFVSGRSLWQDRSYQKVASECQFDIIGSQLPSTPACRAFLGSNSKANLQWELEHNFYTFEKQFAIT